MSANGATKRDLFRVIQERDEEIAKLRQAAEFDADWVNSLPRDSHGFTRTQDEWDMLAKYARRLRRLAEYRSAKIARLRTAFWIATSAPHANA